MSFITLLTFITLSENIHLNANFPYPPSLKSTRPI